MKRNGQNIEYRVTLNIPHLRKKIKKTCANRPVSCVNGENPSDFGSPKETVYRCVAALGRRACPLRHRCAMPLPGLRLPASASLSLASCWPLPQQLLPVSAAGGGRRRCSQRERLLHPAKRARTLTESFSAPFCSKNFLKIHFIGLLLCYTPVRTKRHRREEE